MLVLSRKKNEAISIFAEDGTFLARVRVTEIQGDKVRLGFDADKTTRITRDELLTKEAVKEGSSNAG